MSFIIEDNSQNNSELSKSDDKTVSKGKIIFLFVVLILVLGFAFFLAYKFVTANFGFTKRGQEALKTTKTFSNAPDSIGKNFELPIIAKESTSEIKEEEIFIDPPPQLITPPPMQDFNVEQEPTDNTPTLSDRRLGSGIRSFSGSGQSKKEKEEIIPSRQVKFAKNIDYLLVKGTKIPCVLETNIINEQQGFTSCIVSENVYSANARVLLIEKGTKVTGAYINNSKNGDRRLQIIWDRLITPYDLIMELDSPVTDRLGASGVTGKVDNRWGTRIGSALLVSLIGDSLRFAGEKNKNAEVIVESETVGTTQNIAEKILDKNINLSPIIYIREGEVLNIYVADDIDFSSIYQVKSNNWRVL